MARISSPLRGKTAKRRMDLTDLRDVLARGEKPHVRLGVVHKPGTDPHWRLEGGRLLVEVATQPEGEDLTCRLATSGGGGGQGLWRVPAVGAEVLVAIPSGELTFMPTIVAVFDNGSAPSRANDQRTVLVAEGSVEITAPKVYLGPSPADIVEATDGLVHGKGVDTFTGSTYAVLQSTSLKVFGNK